MHKVLQPLVYPQAVWQTMISSLLQSTELFSLMFITIQRSKAQSLTKAGTNLYMKGSGIFGQGNGFYTMQFFFKRAHSVLRINTKVFYSWKYIKIGKNQINVSKH